MQQFKRKANPFSENKGISYIQLKSKIAILHASMFGSGWVPPEAHVGEALNSTFALPVLWCFMFVIFTAWSWVEPLCCPGMNGKQIKLVVVFYFWIWIVMEKTEKATTNLTNFPQMFPETAWLVVIEGTTIHTSKTLHDTEKKNSH